MEVSVRNITLTSPVSSRNDTFVSLQVLIKPKPVFQTAVVSEQTRQLVTETLQQVSRSSDIGQSQSSGQDGSAKDEPSGFTETSTLPGEASHSTAQGILPFFMARSRKTVPHWAV